jgi:hypothetical protein
MTHRVGLSLSIIIWRIGGGGPSFLFSWDPKIILAALGGGNQSTRWKPPICRKSLTNFITYCCTPRVNVYCSFNNTMIKVVLNFSSFFGSIWFTRPLTIHNTVHWSLRHTQSFRCLLIYPIKWDNWLLRCLFLTKKGKQPFYKLLAFRR